MTRRSEPRNHDRTAQLQKLMHQAGFSSFRSFAQAATVSEPQIRRLRQGQLSQMRLETLQKISQSLNLPLADLLTIFGDQTGDQALSKGETEAIKQEYDRLQTQLSHQREALWQEFQQSSLQILESLLLQLPTAAHAARQNPQLSAVKLLPLLSPIDRLLETWDIHPIATVGSEVAYDPQQHQLMEGSAKSGDPVRVRYTGYCQGDRGLYRAKVSPVDRPGSIPLDGTN